MCSHVTIVPPLRALLDSPDLRLDGFVGPGHVSTVVGARPFEFIPADYGKPIVVAGFEPLDILQAIRMILAQLAEGRCEVENQYARVVPYEGNRRALEVMAEVFELRPHFEWRGLGFISQSGLKLSEAYADLDAELRFSVPGVRVADPKACQCGEVLKGVIKPWECKVFGTACTPERPIGTCMVSSEGACAAYYNYGRFAREREARLMRCRRCARSGSSGSSRPPAASPPSSATTASTWPTARAARRRRAMIEGLFAPAFGALGVRGRRARSRSTAPRGVHDRLVRRQAASLPGRLDRRPGGQRHGQRLGGRRRAPARAQPVADPRGGAGGGRPQRRGRGDRRAAARAAEVFRSWTGDTKVVERGAADQMYVCTTGVGQRDPRARLAANAIRQATASCCRARSASMAPRSCSRAASSSSTRTIESDTRSLWPVADALLEESGPALRCMRDATRGGVASVLNELARSSGVAMLVREAAVPVEPAVAGASELLGIDPMYVANEGKLVAFVAEAAADAALAALRSVPGCRARRRDRGGAHRAARDGAGGDELRRQAGDGPAGGRSAAADLLSERGATDGDDRRVRGTQARRRR